MADFYDATAGQSIADPATAELLRLSGDVRGMRVLDAACGQGRVARELARRGAQVTGVDISLALLTIASALETDQLHGISYVHADVTGTDVLAGQEFDAAVCNYGLTDIDNLDGLMTTIARIVRPGGWFVFSLLHPCFPGWDRDAPSSWRPEFGYFREGWWLASSSGFRGRVGAQHRMLSTYLNSLARHGFALEEVAEPVPEPEWAGRLPGAAPVPLYLAARYRRTASIQ